MTEKTLSKVDGMGSGEGEIYLDAIMHDLKAKTQKKSTKNNSYA